MDAILVMITAGSAEEAGRLTDALLDARLVACVNQAPDVRSFFWWQGRRDHADEVLLLAKTRPELWPRVLETVRGIHGYEVFGAIALPIVECNPDYLQWITESTTAKP